MGIAYCTDDAELDIGLSLEGVDQTSVGSPSHGIDREVSANKIFLDRGHERHRIGVPSILILSIAAEGRHLERRIPQITVMVPWATPVSWVLSPARSQTRFVSAHIALQAISISEEARPNSASRTKPPTAQASNPAASNIERSARASSGSSIRRSASKIHHHLIEGSSTP